MNLQQLQYFQSVTRAGSLSQASLVLGLSQPALSKQIRDLEEELRVQLFHRTGRGVVLTPDGQRLYEHAIAILDRISLAKREAQQHGGKIIDELTLAATPTIGRMLIGPLSRRIVNAFPGIQLRLMEGFSVHLLEWLTTGRIDVAMLYASGAATKLHAEPLLQERLHLISPAAGVPAVSEIQFSSLSELPLILPAAPHGLRLLIDEAASRAGVRLKAVVEADGFGTLLALVREGVGHTILPAAAVQPEIASGQLRAAPITAPEIVRTMVVATAINRVHSRSLSAVVAHIKGEAKALSRRTDPKTALRLTCAAE